MNTFTLTERDLEKFAATARHALALFIGQYALLRPKFPTVTDAAVEAMTASVVEDPTIGQRKAPIDSAVYFAALYTMAVRKLEAQIAALASCDDAVTALHAVFELIPACANIVNALTLLSRGGLMSELHLQERAPIIMAQRHANKGHEKSNAAKAWVRSEWAKHKGEYEGNKSAFARIYVRLVPQEFPNVTVTDKTITDSWLR
jgi:hypothetical protein